MFQPTRPNFASAVFDYFVRTARITPAIQLRLKRLPLSSVAHRTPCVPGASKLSAMRASDIGNPGAASQLEKQADRFAADLLMPRYLFVPSVAQLKRLDFESVDEVATNFSTSRLATALRCVDIGTWPLVLICHGPLGRRWFKRAVSVPDDWFPREDLDPSSPSFAVLFGTVERTRTQSVAASLWFDRCDASRYRITEQSLKAHGGTMLTLLALTDPKMLIQGNR